MGKFYVLRQKNSGMVERFTKEQGEQMLRTYRRYYEILERPEESKEEKPKEKKSKKKDET